MTLALLNNRYQVLRVLGSGGFGETFLAEDTQMPSNRRCVIKQLKPVANNPQVYQLVQQRFQQEAAILEELGDRSNQIPKLYAYFIDNGQFYLVQEYIEGHTLTQKMQQQGVLHESTVKGILIDILPVLEFVHSKRIVHRDIKPDNIILRFSDGKPILIDFGAVKVSMGTIITASGNSNQSIVIGTPGFMPMEQSIGRPVFSSDLYSLGLTAIYLLTGKLPADLPTDPETGDILWRNFTFNISPDLGAVLDKAIQQSPRDRYLSARDMLTALQTPSIPTAVTVPVSQPTLITTPVSAGYVTAPTVASPTPLYQPIPTPTPNPAISPKGLAPWQQGVIIGGAIGTLVVSGLWLVRGQLSNQPQPLTTIASSPSPTFNNQQPSPPNTSKSLDSTSYNSDRQVEYPAKITPTENPVIPSNTNTSTTEKPSASASTLTEAGAKNLINQWLQAKQVMFAPPYNPQPAAELTTGEQYEQVAGYDGSINSLKTDGHSYKYGLQQIDGIDEFSVNGNQAVIQVKVTEDRKLLDKNGNILPKETDFKTRTVRYNLQFVDRRWKIASTQILTK
ncbi:MAG: protein kinase domain-containing protein [Aulosira sp. ZfuVER01]|nr:IMS domain-containing protein [Aulosira sp. ZfuVER01]MDZ8001603.1 IMS domain-containing protein [Aulosira sp. DedVER01a]MDZ8051529.1 IMS domain-containing protein [Aulosira sp. ZfuCHP01]